MITNDFTDKAVLITGGTKGIGLAIGLTFGRLGARVHLTHKWGSADENAIRAQFAEAGAPEPGIHEADVSDKKDTKALLETLHAQHERLEVFVSNVAFAQVTGALENYKKRSLLTSLGYTAWPFVGYLQEIRKTFGSVPRYAVGLSSDGVENYYPGYDFVAVSKKIMEVLCRYINEHLWEEDIRINVVRSRPVETDSLDATFGEDFAPFLRKYGGEHYLIQPQEVADAVLALCSGLMDGVSGQELLLDRGVCFENNLMRLYEKREEFGL